MGLTISRKRYLMLTIKNFCCLQCVILFHFVLTIAVKWLNFLSVRRKSHHPNEAHSNSFKDRKAVVVLIVRRHRYDG